MSSNGIRAGSITADQIATGAIGAAQIAVGSITAAQLALGSITGAQIAAGSITATNLAPGIQLPLTGTCPAGQYLRGVAPTGAILCEPGFWPTFSSNVDTLAGSGGATSIAIGIDGLPVISQLNSTLNVLRVTVCGNAPCTLGTVSVDVDDPGPTVVGQYSSLAIAPTACPPSATGTRPWVHYG